jgi:hypothetical protein
LSLKVMLRFFLLSSFMLSSKNFMYEIEITTDYEELVYFFCKCMWPCPLKSKGKKNYPEKHSLKRFFIDLPEPD